MSEANGALLKVYIIVNIKKRESQKNVRKELVSRLITQCDLSVTYGVVSLHNSLA